jgi:hypothetical protein
MARYVIGLENVLANIQREMMAVRGRTYKGMFAAMKFLENEMNTTPPLVPEGNAETRKHYVSEYLKDSWFITGTPHPTNPIVFAGYKASYAEIVHENIGAINWTRPGSGPKWLQIHFDRNRPEMLMIVAQHARVPGTTRVGGLSSGASFVNIADRTNERNVEF